jgi:hypothetical protein
MPVMPTRTLPARAAGAALQTIFVVSLLWSAFFLAWVTLVPVDFGYGWLYERLAIAEHIERYGPQNLYKQGFEHTDRQHRLALFGEIVTAIHQRGAGLAELSYPGPGGRSVTLLREPERIHLQSVARLIETLRWISYAMLGLLIVSVALLWRMRRPLPAARRVLGVTLALVALTALMVLALGPERVFNTLHTWIFPAGEQWYFYYQESLMTTLMKAPDLFGAIALLLLPLALGYFALLLLVSRRLLLQAEDELPLGRRHRVDR